MLWGLDLAFERVHLFFTWDPLGKADLLTNYIDERMAEAQAMANINNTKAMQKALDVYYEQENETLSEISKVELKSKVNVTPVLKRLLNVTSTHLNVLNQLLAKVPAPAKEGIQNAIEKSSREKTTLELKVGIRTLPETISGIISNITTPKPTPAANKTQNVTTPKPSTNVTKPNVTAPTAINITLPTLPNVSVPNVTITWPNITLPKFNITWPNRS